MHEPSVISLDNVEALQEHVLQLAQSAQRQLILFTPDLEPALYNHGDFVDAILKLIKRSKYTEVRILTQDTRHAQASGHRLLKLLHYSSAQFQIRKLTANATQNDLAYLISDDKHLLRRQNTKIYQGLCYTHDRTRVKDQLEDFDLLWNTAILDPNLRTLTL